MQESIFAVRNRILYSTEETSAELYKCVFCVDENKTPEMHDATVFFSAEQLVRHIALRHKPLRQVDAIKISYGNHPNQDFDICVTSRESNVNPPSTMSTDINSFPTGHATKSHRVKGSSKFYPQDPNGHPTLKFATGAPIAGITFPAKLKGQWCYGYHDGSEGHFPSETIQLNAPSKMDIIMTPKSSLVATARWDHNPKDSSTGWLAFSKKEKITHIGFLSEDHWCYSGQNCKGKFGFFPKDFVVLDEGFKGKGGEVVNRRGDAGTLRSRFSWKNLVNKRKLSET
jgi:hypothetical protein